MDAVSRLCAWYERQCADDWHEDHGIRIDTLDNPGWSLKVDLKGTPLCEKDFQELRAERSDRDWITVRKNGDTFEGFCSPKALNEMIRVFLSWAE
ncbi:MAG TPA: immunity 53 family protein [Rhizobium sp.]|nr:immunity 53 family protein [Rhizobium sp.]